MGSNRLSRLGVLYAGTILLSAFLLFQLQPLMSRFILPWFGGSPAVWTTCLLFFQTVLFAGYAYAHWSEHFLRPGARTIVHLTLIGAALLTLPITPSDGWKPLDSGHPTGRILVLLTICIGLPYFVLSSTGPLVQAWFSRAFANRSPYRLYSLSNFGSLLALLSYPFVVEPALSGNAQGTWWTAGFVLFALLCGCACWLTGQLPDVTAQAAQSAAMVTQSGDASPAWLRRLLWLGLPALASMLLLATTNHVCQDMPAVPFLWVVPLSLYLVSFILVFDHQRWYRRLPCGLAAMIAVYLAAGMSHPAVWAAGWLGHLQLWIWGTPPDPDSPWFGYEANVVCQFSALFALCMLCHGELVRLRPAPRQLTSFYLMIAAGGALGGLSVAVIAPAVFNTYAEWKIGLVAGFVLAATVAFALARPAGFGLNAKTPAGTVPILHGAAKRGPNQSSPRSKMGLSPSLGPRRWRLSWRAGLWTAGLLLALVALEEIVEVVQSDDQANFVLVNATRNFYGALTVVKANSDDTRLPIRVLYNGSTRHGTQFTDPASRRTPTAYYSTGSGVGQTLEYYLRQSAERQQPLRVGVVGLGVGTLAAYVDLPSQTMRFYEINPDVARLADAYFSYLSDARQRGARVEIVLGDARLSLERELDDAPQAFDLLVLDAFSSDSIPMHLLTREAFDIYLGHLAGQGALAVHVSSRYLDLAPVVYGLAESFRLAAVSIDTSDSQHAGWTANWIILSRNQQLLAQLRTAKDHDGPAAPTPPLPLWTDQRHNLLEILK